MAGYQTAAQKQAAERARLAALEVRNREINAQRAAELQAARQKQDQAATNFANLARSITDLTMPPARPMQQGWAPPAHQGWGMQQPQNAMPFTPPMPQGWAPPQMSPPSPGLSAWAPPAQGFASPSQGFSLPAQAFAAPAATGIAGLGA